MSTTVLEEAEEALVGLDAEKLVSLYADEFVFEDTSTKDRITAKDQLREYFDRLFSLPVVSFSNVSFFALGDRGAGAWTWSGRSRRSGADYSIQGASLFILGDDRIKEERIFYDPRDALA
jgi:ketosteroid isomerase-like protein